MGVVNFGGKLLTQSRRVGFMEGNVDVSKLVSQKEKAERQAEIDAMNASLAKLKGDHESAKQLMKSCRQNKQVALDKQDEIDKLHDQQPEEQIESEIFELKEEIEQYYLEPIQSAVEAFENGEVDELIEDLNIDDLKLVSAVLQSVLLDEDGKDHIYDVIRSVRAEEVAEEVDSSATAVIEEEEDATEEDYDTNDDDYDEEDEDEEVDSEIENEIYDEMENELGYDFNCDNDEEDFD